MREDGKVCVPEERGYRDREGGKEGEREEERWYRRGIRKGRYAGMREDEIKKGKGGRKD